MARQTRLQGKSMSDVPLRDFIERIIQENNLRRDDLRIEDRRWIDERIQALLDRFQTSVMEVNKARQIQADEYERRLSILNHAHEEAQRVLSTYALAKDFNELKSKVEVDINDNATRLKSGENFQTAFDMRAKVIEEGGADRESRLKSLEYTSNDLRSRLKVAEDMAIDRASRMKGVNTLFQALAGFAVFISVSVAILTYINK